MKELTGMNSSTRGKINEMLNKTVWHQAPNYRHIITLLKKVKQSKDDASRDDNKKKLEDYIAKNKYE